MSFNEFESHLDEEIEDAFTPNKKIESTFIPETNPDLHTRIHRQLYKNFNEETSPNSYAEGSFVPETSPSIQARNHKEQHQKQLKKEKEKENEFALKIFDEKFIQKTQEVLRGCEVLKEKLTRSISVSKDSDEIEELEDVKVYINRESRRLHKKLKTYQQFVKDNF
jgi:hypothetical protein